MKLNELRGWVRILSGRLGSAATRRAKHRAGLRAKHTTQYKRNDRAKAQQLNKALICRQQRVSIFAYTLALSAIRMFESNRAVQNVPSLRPSQGKSLGIPQFHLV